MNNSRLILQDFFSNIEAAGIRYVLLRNINNELPDNYAIGKKDIDLMIHPEEREKFHKFMRKHKYVSCPHPLDKGSGLVYLYAVYPFEFYKRGGYFFDVCYQMVCKSPNAGEYMPIDMIVNNSAWENRKKDANYGWYVLSDEDMMVHLLTRCIFDKKQFTQGYINAINKLNVSVNKSELKKRLDMVVFKFSDRLIALIENQEFASVRTEYFTFMDY